MVDLDGVVYVFPNKKRQILTRKSWDLLHLASPYYMYQPSHYGVSTSNTIMRLFTLNLPSSQIKETDTIYSSIAPLIVSTNVCFCPSEVNDKTLSFTWMFSPWGCHGRFICGHW